VSETAHPVPTAWARDIVRGAYDLHVHVMPDVFARKTTDLALAARFGELGLGGFALKSHYTMTAERAAVVRTVTGTDVLGAITLNSSVGGINPIAVEICARAGGRLVWFPTFDSDNEARSTNNVQSVGRPPAWAQLNRELDAKGIVREPVRVLDEHGEILPSVRLVLRIAADSGMTVCTGHLAAPEIIAVVAAAADAGIEGVVVTHPDFPSQSVPVEVQRQLADRGCRLERCFGTPYAGRVPWDVMFTNIRACGVENSFISSDLGQVHNPPVEDGLSLMADRLREAGFTEGDTHTMIVENTQRIVRRQQNASTR
jgi:hypothetical protein